MGQQRNNINEDKQKAVNQNLNLEQLISKESYFHVKTNTPRQNL